ncbi:hypothetical protein OPQ81_005086 [Rhizoctonia solani]|nr:hypothetical protein OPQ81_005086 [Rhizoctonia solani]
MSTKDDYSSKKTYDIPQLKDDGSNYNAWKFRQETILALRGLLGAADGTDKAPTPLTAAEAKDAGKVTDYEAAVSAWKKRDREAYAQIVLNMEDQAMADVMRTKSAKGAWAKVIERWEGKGVESLSFLYQQITTVKIEEDEDIATAFNNIRSIAAKMETLGEPISELMLAQMMMNAVPPSYSINTSIIQTTNQPSAITPDMVQASILAEEKRRKNGSSGLTAMVSSLSTKPKPSNSKSSKSASKGKKKEKGPACINCGKPNHTKAECWAKGGGAEGTGPHQKRRTEKQAKDKEAISSSTKTESAKVAVTAEEVQTQHLYALPAIDGQSSNNSWLLDSGASRHMTPNRHCKFPAAGIGRVLVTLLNRQGKKTEAYMNKVLHVPDLNANLMSVQELVNGGTEVIFRKEVGAILTADQGRGPEIGFAHQSKNLYRLNARVTHTDEIAHIGLVEPDDTNERDDREAGEFMAYAAGTTARADLTTWHRRLGHISYEYVLDMVRKGAVRGMDIIGSRSPPKSQCGPCMQGKHTRSPFPDSQNHASEILELMYSDLHGPFPVEAIGGYRYFSVTVDDKSRKMFVHILRSKDEYEESFKQLKTSVENLTGKKVKILRTDGGGEFRSNKFEAWMRLHGIQHQVTEPYSSASNGVAERAIRTLNDSQRTMRADSGLPDKYWGYAILHAANVWNVTGKRFLNGRTPEEIFTGKIPDVSRLRIFGCKAWSRVPDKERTKLQARSIECQYLGYAPNRKCHVLVERATGKITFSRDVVFDEGGETRQRIVIEDRDEEEPKQVDAIDTQPKREPEDFDTSRNAVEPIKVEAKPEKVESKPESVESEPETEDSEPEVAPEPPEAPSIPPSEPVAPPPDVRGDKPVLQSAYNPKAEFALAAALEEAPKTFEEAMSRPDGPRWLIAMIEELESIRQHGVWKRADRPLDRNVVDCLWVFSFKRGPDGEIIRYKARLVAKGYSQRPGVDFGEISSPVATSDAYRVLLSKVTELNLELLQLDIKTAFLHGNLEEEIYMEQPEGFKDADGSVWRLEKALYGLKQAARAFYLRLREVLVSMGFTRCEMDHAVFWRREDKSLAIIPAHVDDMLVAGTPRAYLEGVKAELAKSLDIVDLGEPRMFVGVEIERDREAGTLKISQRRYIDDILKRFGMEGCKSCVTPMAETPNLPKLDSPTIDRTLYQRGVGSLMYAVISTRPDIAYSTGLLAQHAANPGKEHWAALQRVLRYLRGTRDVGIVYDRSKPSELVGFVDADYAGDPHTSRSTSGWTFKMAGGSVAWSSRKQPTISLSSTEAEYVAAASAARELIWIRSILSELGFLENGPTTVFTDNQSSMALAKNPSHHQNTKHIRVKYHFIREMIELKEVELKFIPTDKQIADLRNAALSTLEKSIEYFSHALDLTPNGHPELPDRHTNLGASYQGRFQRLGKLVDLEKATQHKSRALDLTPQGDPDLPLRYASLGVSYGYRFQRLGELADIENAIEHLSRAVDLTPDDHPHLPRRHADLGVSYHARFQRLGELSDLEKAIQYISHSVDLIPNGHPDLSQHHAILAASYHVRFQRLGELLDLENSTQHRLLALDLTPEDHPDLPLRHAELGVSYQERFQRLDELIDLEKAIEHKARALDLTPGDHPDLPERHAELGISYQERFQLLHELNDLEKAINYKSCALGLTPDGHPELPRYHASLGVAYRERFQHQCELVDLERAIEHGSHAINLTPEDHPNLSWQHYNLALSCFLQYQHTNHPAHLSNSLNSFRQASQLSIGPPREKFRHALGWAMLASNHAKFNCIEAYQATIDLLPEFIWLGATTNQQYKDLSTAENLAINAAFAAIGESDYILALEWLEQARCVVWNQRLMLQSPLDDLQSSYPSLATRLRAVTEQLRHTGSEDPATRALISGTVNPEQVGQQRRHLAQKYNKLLAEARTLPGFEDFLRPKKAGNLLRAAHNGPIVIISCHQVSSDALIIIPGLAEFKRLSLPSFTAENAKNARSELETSLRRKGLRERGVKVLLPSGYKDRMESMLLALWDNVVNPILDFLGFKNDVTVDNLPHITWCPTGALSFLPLHAAGDYSQPRSRVFNYVISSYTPTITALLACSPSSLHNTSRVLVIGQPNTPGRKPLPGTTTELACLETHMQNKFQYSQLIDDQATIANVLDAMEQHDWVHLACHAHQNVDDPTKSGFFLHDGTLDLASINRRSFRNKGLAFLSACQTATGDEKLPDEAIHLASGMLMAGYSSVIGTMWSVVDADAPLIADKVYGELMKEGKVGNGEAGKALHEAVGALRDKIGEKEFGRWVPYIHIGR